MKINYNYEYLNKNVVSDINNALANLNQAIQCLNNISVPYDYYYSKSFDNLVESSKAVKKNLEKINDWIFDSNNNFVLSFNDIIRKSNSIANTQIRKRNSSIK